MEHISSPVEVKEEKYIEIKQEEVNFELIKEEEEGVGHECIESVENITIKTEIKEEEEESCMPSEHFEQVLIKTEEKFLNDTEESNVINNKHDFESSKMEFDSEENENDHTTRMEFAYVKVKQEEEERTEYSANEADPLALPTVVEIKNEPLLKEEKKDTVKTEAIATTSHAKDIVIMMEKCEDNLSDTSKTSTRKHDDVNSENSEAEFVIPKRKEIHENEKITYLSKQNRKKELARLRKIRFLERQKNLEKGQINQASVERSREFSRQRSQRYRDKKRMERLNTINIVTFPEEQSTVNVQSNVKNHNRIHDLQIAGSSWLNVPFVQQKKELAKLRKIKFLERQTNLEKDKINHSSVERSKEFSRQRSQRYRDKKRIDCLNTINIFRIP